MINEITVPSIRYSTCRNTSPDVVNLDFGGRSSVYSVVPSSTKLGTVQKYLNRDRTDGGVLPRLSINGLIQ